MAGPGPPAGVMLVEVLQVLRVPEEEVGVPREVESQNMGQQGQRQDETEE